MQHCNVVLLYMYMQVNVGQVSFPGPMQKPRNEANMEQA